MLIAEELFLLLRRDDGKPESAMAQRGYGLAAAVIADLVVAGRRNREIAAEMFVSDSTVEAHLTRIYRKLGLRGRQELVAWCAARESSRPV